jgi:hypothetical protein
MPLIAVVISSRVRRTAGLQGPQTPCALLAGPGGIASFSGKTIDVSYGPWESTA